MIYWPGAAPGHWQLLSRLLCYSAVLLSVHKYSHPFKVSERLACQFDASDRSRVRCFRVSVTSRFLT